MEPLIPGLNDDLALLCLVRMPRGNHQSMLQVSKSWREALSSNSFYEQRSQLGFTEPWIYVQTEDGEYHNRWRAFDPSSGTWHQLPLPPHVGDGQVRGLGCAAVKGKLYVFGGWRMGGWRMGCPPLKEVYCFDPCTNCWSEVPGMNSPRAYMASSVIGDCLFVAGGITQPRRHFDELLVSAEKFDTTLMRWLPIADMRSPLRGSLGTSYKGQFYVGGKPLPQSQVYNPERDEWSLISACDFASGLVSPSASKGDLILSLKDALKVWDPHYEMWKNIGGGTVQQNQISCLTFLDDKIYLLGNDSSVVSAEFDFSFAEKKLEKEELEEEQLLVRSIDFVCRGGSFKEETVMKCFVIEM